MRTGTSGFVGQQLVEARDVRGLTQVALSQMIGVAKSTLSKWENGKALPEFDSIEKLSSTLGVPRDWFFEQPTQISTVYYFRSNNSATLKARTVAETRLKWTYRIADKMSYWLGLPKINLPDSPSRQDALLLTDEEIENYAMACREKWNLNTGPITNLTRVAEANGIVIAYEDSDYGSMDGVSAWINERPFVWLSANKDCAVRNRFNLAHELGHIVLHRFLEDKDTTAKEYAERERQAHLFASALLMPAESITLRLRGVTLDRLLVEKQYWGASVAALIRRAHTLEVITEEHYSRLMRNLSYRKWRTKEPLDDVLPIEKPLLLTRCVEALLNSAGFNKEDILIKFGLSHTDIQTLCGLPDEIWNPKVKKPKLRILDNAS